MTEPRQEPEVEIIGDESEPSYAMELPTLRTPGFTELFGAAYAGSEEWIRSAWVIGRDAWLRMKEGKSGSRHTRRSYEQASAQWITFLADLRHEDGRPVRLWEATTEHVRLWQEHLAASGLAASTVNQRLAACSSWYTFMERERILVRGIEVSAFMDRAGRFRANPFAAGNVQRQRAEQYGHARILTPEESQRLINHLQERSHLRTGARNYALLLAYLLTGYRNAEVVSLRWGAIRPNRNQPGAWVVEWRGKGNKRQSDPLPNRVYYAIVHYLKTSGRHPDTMEPDDYIFIPHVTHGVSNLVHQDDADDDEPGARHISSTQAQAILRTALKRAGVERPEEVRIHDLRHTFAHQYRRRNGDLEGLRSRLHHESLATTGIYAREVLDDPVDDYSEGLFQGLLGF